MLHDLKKKKEKGSYYGQPLSSALKKCLDTSVHFPIESYQGRQFLSRSGGHESGKFNIIRGLFSVLVSYHLI